MTTKMQEAISEADVELAERYAKALETIDAAAEILEADVELAERYAHALAMIEAAPEITEAEVERVAPRLWISSAQSPYGNPFGLLAVMASTKAEAVLKARDYLVTQRAGYVPTQQYIANLLEHLEDRITQVEEGVVVDWRAAERR